VLPQNGHLEGRRIQPTQRRIGLAAWLGWLFDGLDMHLYTLVALAFVGELMGRSPADPAVATKASIIQAAFLLGWAVGGGVFGRLGDLLGRSRALILTILTYAGFTGLSFFAQSWEQLLLCRFLAALGIGGEWAVGASLLSETWPAVWRPWIAAALQCAVNCGVLLACLAGALNAGHAPRNLFLVGLLPALLTLWIRKAVPETDAWKNARLNHPPPALLDLLGPNVRSTTLRVLLICAISLTAHWTFMFWQTKHVLSLPEIAALPKDGKDHALVLALTWLMLGSLAGNFLAGALAARFGYRKTLASMLFAYAALMTLSFCKLYSWPLTQFLFVLLGVCSGLFALFTMCLPPLFPVLLRTTGSGICYNLGRIIAAAGTLFFGIFNKVDNTRLALLYSGFLFLPAALAALLLPPQPSPISETSPPPKLPC
jgi:MFS family permease